MKKYIVFSQSYDERSGGAVVLHKLCSILNDQGSEAYLYPFYKSFELSKESYWPAFFGLAKSVIKKILFRYKVNPVLTTPLYKGKKQNFDDEWVVIYPEIVFGNPLGAKNVVRWFLHQPGFHTGKVYYGKNELYFKFNSAVLNFTYQGSKLSEKELKVIHYPLEHYNKNGVAQKRQGSAYCLRKGKNKNIQHDLKDSILIDGMSHEEVAKIFKRVKVFISYDTYTAYSIFATLCGCDSIVIPDDGVEINDWYSNPTDRYGISYGLNDIENARETSSLVLKHVQAEEEKSKESVKRFTSEVDRFFK